MKLLIADDNAEIRALVRRMCAAVAAETRECADGFDAVQAFDEFQPDWSILDLVMPRADGLVATRQILARHPDARIIVMTQHRGPEYEATARAAGACAFVPKDNLPLLLLLMSPPPKAPDSTV